MSFSFYPKIRNFTSILHEYLPFLYLFNSFWPFWEIQWSWWTNIHEPNSRFFNVKFVNIFNLWDKELEQKVIQPHTKIVLLIKCLNEINALSLNNESHLLLVCLKNTSELHLQVNMCVMLSLITLPMLKITALNTAISKWNEINWISWMQIQKRLCNIEVFICKCLCKVYNIYIEDWDDIKLP